MTDWGHPRHRYEPLLVGWLGGSKTPRSREHNNNNDDHHQ